MPADRCGATRGGLVCDRAPHANGDHRGYLEAVDEVLFWPSTSPAPTLQAVLGMDQPWPILDVLERLAAAADHLLEFHSCDHLGYEGINAARDAARAHVSRLRDLVSSSRARS